MGTSDGKTRRTLRHLFNKGMSKLLQTSRIQNNKCQNYYVIRSKWVLGLTYSISTSQPNMRTIRLVLGDEPCVGSFRFGRTVSTQMDSFATVVNDGVQTIFDSYFAVLGQAVFDFRHGCVTFLLVKSTNYCRFWVLNP